MIVHLGLGAFARSHLAGYLHDLAEPSWPVCGVGLLPGDAAVRDAKVDRGYPLVLRHPDGSETVSSITSVTDYLFLPSQPQQVLDRLVHPSTAIVSLTITEGGYFLDSSGAFAPTDELLLDVGRELPTSVPGLIVEALRRRRSAGSAPFAVMSCDNIESNGAITATCVAGYADLVEPGLGEWVHDSVAFPSSMVDRITPAATAADRAAHGPGVVVAEPFRQWVLEDRFTLGRPPLERVGVQVVADVRPYELMKLRLLNGGHQALAYIGVLLGYELVHEAAADPLVQQLLRRYWAEACPTLSPVPGVDLAHYHLVLLERFGNSCVQDTLARLCAYSSDRIPAFLLPVVAESTTPTPACAVVLASWARYLEVGDEIIDNRTMPAGEALLEDPLLDGLRDRLRPDFLRAITLLRADPRDALSRSLVDGR